MKISSINFNPYRVSGIQKKQASKNNHQPQNQNNLHFGATIQDFLAAKPGYVIVVNQDRVNALTNDKKHLTDVGEHLRTTEDKLIRNFFVSQTGFFGSTSEKKTKMAYDNLMPYVNKARKRYKDICTELRILYQQPTTKETIEKIRKLEKEKLQLDVKAEMAMKYTDEVEITIDDSPKIETDEDRAWWDTVMY